MGEVDVRGAVDRVLAALREAGRSEVTIRVHEVVLDRFALFLAGRGLGTVSERVCIDFVENQTGVRLGSLRVGQRQGCEGGPPAGGAARGGVGQPPGRRWPVGDRGQRWLSGRVPPAAG